MSNTKSEHSSKQKNHARQAAAGKPESKFVSKADPFAAANPSYKQEVTKFRDRSLERMSVPTELGVLGGITRALIAYDQSLKNRIATEPIGARRGIKSLKRTAPDRRLSALRRIASQPTMFDLDDKAFKSALARMPLLEVVGAIKALSTARVAGNDLVKKASLIANRIKQLLASKPSELWDLQTAVTPQTAVSVLSNRAALIKAGVLIGAAELETRLGKTRQAISKARLAGNLFALNVSGVYYYPAFFADERYQFRQLTAVSKLLCVIDDGAKLQFFLTPKESLDGLTPLAALEAGELAAVKAAAEGFAER